LIRSGPARFLPGNWPEPDHKFWDFEHRFCRAREKKFKKIKFTQRFVVFTPFNDPILFLRVQCFAVRFRSSP
jgi:hypothetical protein